MAASITSLYQHHQPQILFVTQTTAMAAKIIRISFFGLTGLLLKQFFKQVSNWLLIIIFLVAGYYALYQGYAEKQKKWETVQAFRNEKDSILHGMKMGLLADTTKPDGKEKFSKSSGLFSGLWYTRLPSYKTPVSTSIFNIGQSDVFTYYYLFAAENFEMQLFKQTEITNPLRALAGHFDVSFWIVYLLPLLVLLWTFNVLSSERDNGNWRLIASQGIGEKGWLQSKILIVAALVIAILFAIGVTGMIINFVQFKQPPSISDLLFISTAVIYIFFWLLLFYFINSLRKPTTYNALVSGIAWIGICLVLPVVVSKVAESIAPLDNTEISTYSRRPQNPQIEDSKAFAANMIQNFALQQTGLKSVDTDSTKPAFMLRTYQAYHWLLTKERWPQVQQYFSGVEKRQKLTNWSVLINPASSTDGFLTAMADNDAAAYHHFVEQTRQLHQGLQGAFYPALFGADALTIDNYNMIPDFQYQPNNLPLSLCYYFIIVSLLAVVLFVSGNRHLKRSMD